MSIHLASLIALCAPLVHPVTMQALIALESAGQPYAVSINYPERLALTSHEVPRLQRQPVTIAEALAVTRELEGQGLTVSIGIAQINEERLAWLRDRRIAERVEQLLDPCTNLRAAQAILIDCWEQEAATRVPVPQRLHRAFSCYNSGNASTGLRNGYVRRLFEIAHRCRISFAEAPPAT